jgi:hypothetical protein
MLILAIKYGMSMTTHSMAGGTTTRKQNADWETR